MIAATTPQFPELMQRVALARQILDGVDWMQWRRQMKDEDGMLCFRDPTLFMRIQADPGWHQKVELVSAAEDFCRQIDAVKESVAPGEAAL